MALLLLPLLLVFLVDCVELGVKVTSKGRTTKAATVEQPITPKVKVVWTSFHSLFLKVINAPPLPPMVTLRLTFLALKKVKNKNSLVCDLYLLELHRKLSLIHI